jgi:hypothetical protein
MLLALLVPPEKGSDDTRRDEELRLVQPELLAQID